LKPLIQYLKSNNLALYIIAIILLFPALFINLGLLPLITDEPTRGIVALEMTLTDNYFVPTINGEFYYNKPPLYNWILILSTKLCGGFSEFALRLPTVISLLFFGFLIFVFVRKHYGNKIAILNALILITGGRVLLWDSFQGLIDIFYSSLVFLSFMLIYHFYQKSKFYYLFLFSYLITALGFLMKGMPSILFQGLTLLVFFIYMKNWKKLFSLAHFTGLFLFALIIGSYYYTYYQYNSLENIYSRLFIESSQRTVVGQGFLKALLHIFIFPVEMMYQFAPWTILIVCLFRKGLKKIVLSDPFIKFSFLIFIINIAFYWISPAIHPRYLFMLFPLLFIVLTFMYEKQCKINDIQRKIPDYILLLLCFLAIPGAMIFPFIEVTKDIPYIFLKSAFLAVMIAILSFLFIKLKDSRLIIFVIVILLFRIAFNVFLMPERSSAEKQYKADAIEVGRMTAGEDLYVYDSTPIDHDASFYISRERGTILKKEKTVLKDDIYYLVDNNNLKKIRNNRLKINEFYTFEIKFQGTRLYLIKVY